MLKKLGYAHVTSTWNGQKMIDIVKSSLDYDLILCDLMMPVMDGLQASLEIQRFYSSIDQSSKPPAIVALTANAQPEVKKTCFDHGMVGYLSKPLTILSLQLEIQRIFPEC